MNWLIEKGQGSIYNIEQFINFIFVPRCDIENFFPSTFQIEDKLQISNSYDVVAFF